MSLFRRSPDERRVRALRDAPPGPLRDYLSVPLPAPSVPLGQLRLLAVDIETTGLDPGTDRILSIGYVPVDGGSVVLGGAGRAVVRGGAGAAGEDGVGRSATVHGLTDDTLAGGEPLEDAVADLLRALTGRALLAHFARIETGFLSAACERLWGVGMPCAVVDTLALEERAVAGRWRHEAPRGALRLWSARERHGLPVYRAHEALTDALACAELYLAQRAELEAGSPGTTLTLRQVMA
ncbi:exonuclease domain-containing protein [Fodinibacter luteus]|uniref:Exonuclease domain-containing protein n=1 Tax=Fodinibacter luteus TaxID=552064 RepID=A0ABP8K2N1_9MICO